MFVLLETVDVILQELVLHITRLWMKIIRRSLIFFIAHVRNAGNSQNMEKYGLKYLVEYLTSHGLDIDTLTTD